MNPTSTGEAVQFWILGTIAVIGALGVVTARKAVYSALFLAMTMVILAIFYIAQGAVFLGVAQVVVYTGAVMMLFLFVLMLVGIDSSDSLVETLRGQRVASVVVGIGFGLLLIGGIGRFAVAPRPVAASTEQIYNVEGLAELIFVRYVWAFELTGALLITATIGAMVLAHRERFGPRLDQAEMSRERLRNWARGEGKLTPMPSPGVYAQHNAVDIPALLPDGTFADSSVSDSLPRREVSTTPPGERPELERGGR
ncbi:MAG TPA: NADH-quinone oxidoreductase subunit J [Aldersonia sp.]